MTSVVNLSTSRGLKRVLCVNSSSVPASVAGNASDPGNSTLSGTGIYKVSDDNYPLSSGGASGIQRLVRMVPCSTTSATYDLVVFGAFWLGDQWLWQPLFKGSVVATLQHTGVNSATSIATSEFLPLTITEAGTGAADNANITNYGSGVGPAHVVLDVRGCQYLLLQASTSGKFALLGGYS